MSLTILVACGECEHNWTDATCTAPSTCTLCGETRGSITEHVFGEWSTATEPTCTVSGEQIRVCKCGETERSPIPANHNIVTHTGKAATCTAIGYKDYETCTKCDYTTYEAIELLPHDTVSHEAKAPTCQAVGHDAYETCKNCGV